MNKSTFVPIVVVLVTLVACNAGRGDQSACAAKEEPTEIAASSSDTDGNNIRDELDRTLDRSADSDCFDVIVQLNAAPTDTVLAEIRGTVGNFPIRSKWDVALYGFSANMTKRQIITLSKHPSVVLIVPNGLSHGG